MDDVNAIALDITDKVARELKEQGMDMSIDMEDSVLSSIVAVVEELAGYPDYRNYN